MKKTLLASIAVLSVLGLAGCGNQSSKPAGHHKNTASAKSSSHSHKHQDDSKGKKAASESSTATDGQKASSARQGATSRSNQGQPTRVAANQAQQGGSDNDVPEPLTPQSQRNIARGLQWDGTRRPETFKSENDYKRYTAWHQGANYDPNTNTYTEMNQQQLDQMRQEMNKDGGQSFK